METFSALLAICAGNSPVPGEFPTQRPVTRSFDVFFDLRPNKRLSKQTWGWWFETLSCSLWRHCNGYNESHDYLAYHFIYASISLTDLNLYVQYRDWIHEAVRHLIVRPSCCFEAVTLCIKGIQSLWNTSNGSWRQGIKGDTLHSLCRIVMEYHSLNMYLKATIFHIIMTKSNLIV